jgi:hypothetical protein
MDHDEEIKQPSSGRRPSRRYSDQTKLAHVKAWKLSGLSIREYCHQREITVSAFYQWRRRLLPKVDDSVSGVVAPGGGKFIPLQPVASRVSDGQVFWDLPNNLGRVSGAPAAMHHLIEQMRQEGWQ